MILPSDTIDTPNDGPDYKRGHGGALAMNYHVTHDFEVSLAYSYNNADLDNNDGKGEDREHQQLAGTALLWTPGEWYIGAGGGYYRNFVPAREPRLTEFLAEKAFGGEIFVSRNIPIKKGLLESFKPYVAADRLQRTSGTRYQSSHEYLGLSTYFVKGFRIDLERTFTQTSDDLPDENWVRLRYDF